MFSWMNGWNQPAADLPEEKRAGRVIPEVCRCEAGAGRYAVTVTLTAEKDCPEAILFVGKRHMVWHGAMKAGESRTLETTCLLAPAVPDNEQCFVLPDGIYAAVAGAGVHIAGLRAKPAELPCVFLMGDSTVTEQTADVPYAPGAVYAGWGQMLKYHLDNSVCVSDHAISGKTCEAFRAEGNYDNMLPLVRPGDLVLIQFGHNDQKRIQLQADTGYRERILTYTRELRQLGARPVLVTPLARNLWFDDGAPNDLLQAYAAELKKLAAEEGLPLIDLHGWMLDNILREGEEPVMLWYHDQDRTHLNDFGACRCAGMIAEKLAALKLCTRVPREEWPFHGPHDALTAPVKNAALTENAVHKAELKATAATPHSLTLVWDKPADATPDMTYCLMVNGRMVHSYEENHCVLEGLAPDTLYELAVFDMPFGRMVAAVRERTTKE